jgi:hypothetical protein
MFPIFLVPETTIRDAGVSQGCSLGQCHGETLILTLGITRIIEQESLDLSIWGSADGKEWETKPLISFPQKFYCGTYELILDLSDCPGVNYIRAKWELNRWGRGKTSPLFTVYLFVRQLEHEMAAAGA